MANDVTSSDSYVDKLKKTIPGEITSVYMSLKLFAAQALLGTGVPSGDDVARYLKIMIPYMMVMIVIAIAYLYGVSKIRNKLQIAITVLSFFIWAVAIDISYFAQTATAYELPFPFDTLARNSVAFLMFVILWNFCIPIIYAFQGVTEVPPADGAGNQNDGKGQEPIV
ncbi:MULTISPECIES: hypothetical protein [unclassified Rhizobium]|uniref:hypothetical protein n=1 Tax=unclassified Rhizobium TaxID=2613769 RepID=UPI00037A2223|nr:MULTISPECIES: hypothetical protein [unclassified Rhizobium]MBO9192683.1 hypothetical protein [Rhizobium sp. 16-449-1b]